MSVRLLFAAVALLCSFAAIGQVKVGLMVSATGPTSAIGIPQKNTGDLLPRKVGDTTIEYVQLEDGGDSTRAVQNIKKLIQENNIDALIGPSTTPNALAILDFIAEAKVPMMATVGTSSVVEPLDAKKRWVFKTTQNDDLIASALLAHMTKNGVKTIGFIGFNDPYGENWYKVFVPMAEKAGISIVANERYARNDQSTTGQVLKLMAAKPDAVLIAAVGGPAVLPQATLFDQGYKGRIYQTHAVATEDFIKLGKEKVEGTVLAAGPMLVIDEIPATNPTKKVALAYIAAYEKQFGSQARDVRRQHVGRRHPARAGNPGRAQGRQARHGSVPQRVARRGGKRTRGRRHAGRVQHVGHQSQRHGRPRARARRRQGRQVPAARRMTSAIAVRALAHSFSLMDTSPAASCA